MTDLKLFTVGPVPCFPEVLEEMKHQMFGHRSPEYAKLHVETVERLQRFLETDGQVFLIPSAGTGVMEASVRNCVNEKMLCCVSGAFGKRYVDVGVSNGKIVEKLQPPPGKPILPDVLDDTLKKHPEVEAVAVTYNETSLGLINPLQKLADVVKKHGKLLFVDAVSAMGGVELKVDKWDLDICFASSQKCFGIPPGLAITTASEKALLKSEKAKNKGWYFDLKLFEKYQKQESSTPMTPVIPQVFALRKALEIIDREDKQSFFNLYSERNLRIRRGLDKLGLTLFPEKGYESPTVTCVNAPQRIGGPEIYEKMRDKGFELAEGYGEAKERTFRIGNMGYVTFENIDAMLNALGELLAEKT